MNDILDVCDQRKVEAASECKETNSAIEKEKAWVRLEKAPSRANARQ